LKLPRLIPAVSLIVLAACSNPLSPRLPEPEDPKKPDPEQPGVRVVLADVAPRISMV